MASWTDNPQQLTQFNPYISENPVQAMVSVGMKREEEFQQGVQRVQSYYDNLLALPISKVETQAYVKQKVGELNNSVQQSIQGDFSDSRLVNQIGGLAGKIASDPIVQNGVMSTAAIQSGMAKMQESQKAGKSSPENEGYFNNMVSKWQNDGDVTSTFNGSYTPYTDIVGEVVKLYKEIPDSEDVTRDAFRIGDDGKLKYNPYLLKGKSAERVQSVINAVMSRGDVQQQLNISGWARYQGLSDGELYHNLALSTNDDIRHTEDAVKKLQVQLSTDGSVDAKDITAKIEALKGHVESVKGDFGNITSLLKSNPSAAKANLVKRDISSNFMNAFSSEVAVENPIWNGFMKENEFGLQKDKFIWQQFDDNRNYKLKEFEAQTGRINALKTKGKNADGTDAGGGLDYSTFPGVALQPKGEKGSLTFKSETDGLVDRYNHEMWAQANIIAQATGIKPPGIERADGSIIPNSQDYKTPQAAYAQVQEILQAAQRGYAGGQPSTMAKSAYDMLSGIRENVLSRKKVASEVDVRFNNELLSKGVKQEDVPYYLAAIVSKESPGWEDAKAQLIKQHGPEYKTKLGISVNQATIPMPGAGYSPTNTNIVSANGPNYNKFNTAKKALDTSLVSTLAAREQAYKDASGQTIPAGVQFNYTKDSEELPIQQSFNRIIYAAQNGQAASKGQAADVKKLIDNPAKGTNNEYYTSFDNGLGTITVRQGENTATLSGIPEKDYYSAFGNLRSPDAAFDNMFGDKLRLTNWKTTDRGSDGQPTSILLPTDPTSKYAVQYHLVPGTQPGTYQMRLWVSDKDVKDAKQSLVIDGSTFDMGNMSDTQLGKQEVLQMLEVLKDPIKLQLYLKAKGKIQ